MTFRQSDQLGTWLSADGHTKPLETRARVKPQWMLHAVDARQLQKERLDIGLWLRQVMTPWTAITSSSPRCIQFQLKVPLGLPPILADAERLRKVMVSLLANAYRFSPPGGMVCVRVLAHHTCVIISVSDEGIGISPEKLERIFERSYQADGGTANRLGGMDVGLAQSRAIVVAHGACLWAESGGEGHGSTFYISLPVAARQPIGG